MPLTALRQSTTYISRQPKNSGHSIITPTPPNGSCPQLFCKYRPISIGTRERGNAGLRAAPYDSVRAPGIPACSHPLARTATTTNASQTYPNGPHNARPWNRRKRMEKCGTQLGGGGQSCAPMPSRGGSAPLPHRR